MDRLRFAFAIPGMPFQGDTIEHKSLGGSETAAICMARSLVAQGHKATVFSNTDRPGVYDGVAYLPLQFFGSVAQLTPFDIVVAQRLPEYFVPTYESRLNILWCHDLALRRFTQKTRGVMWNIDKVAVLSDFMRAQYMETYGLPEEAFYVTRNGIDLFMFKGLDKIERDPKKLIYTSRPERGLDVLLGKIFPKLLERDPDLRLYIAGYDNPVEHLAPFYRWIVEKIKAFNGKVVALGTLPKRELYKHFAEAACLTYPTPSPTMTSFYEVSCITAMEAMAAGLPIVTSNRGALSETVANGAGELIDGDPQSEEYQERFCDAVLRFTRDRAARERAGNVGRDAAAKLSWDDVAKDWANDFVRMIYERNDNPDTLAYHFYRRSNIILAKKLLDDREALGTQTPAGARLKAKIEKDFGFVGNRKAYAEQYAKIGATHTDIWESSSKEPRLQEIIKWLAAHSEIETVVDIGCGLGVYAVCISNALPKLKIVGVDIDPKTIEWCEKYKAEKALHPDNLSFKIGREDEPLRGFDCALACEVLEHVEEPWDFLNKLQAMVKPGGYCFLTVPYGPWEAMSYDTYPHRAHLWEYEVADFDDDMLKGKADLTIDFHPYGRSPETGESLGHLIISFRADEKRIPPIDLDRKFRLQRPRQTVSATIMAGGSAVDETVLWCLRSVRRVADEIIVADCGLSPMARKIIEEHADQIIMSPKPTEAGFETPRNLALDAATMDFVLWIDTDERLLNTSALCKFLRQNIYAGYSIKQHHFAVDAAFNPDWPVRLFRRKRGDGKMMRFIGMLHEHPETGLNEGPGEVLLLPDVHIAHVGYLTEDIRMGRFNRNHPLLHEDKKKYPNRLLLQHFIMRDNMLICGYVLQQNGGQLTPELRALAEETVAIYREHFMGKRQYANIDSLQYYSQALAILGEGFDVSFEIKAARDGIGDQLNGGKRARFASPEEAIAEIAQNIREKAEPLVGRFW